LNVCRSTVCTSVAGTLLQLSRGENSRLQDRATAFVDDAQPADPAAALQADLLGSIHLPDLVRVLGALRILGDWTSAAWRRPQPCLLKPALQRAFRGQSLGAVQAAQKDEDQAGAPGRVFAAELQRFVAKGGTLLAVGIAVEVRRGERIRTDVAKTLQQMTHRARCEAEGRRNRRRGFALASAALDNLTQGQWGGMRHEQSSLKKRVPGRYS
jgi:hypothetical protein